MTSYYEKYIKNYQKTPKGKFQRQRANAKQRGVEWKLTFEEWWDIWEKSGKWKERGTGSNQYCMARKFDWGAYEVGNVHVVKMRQNSRRAYELALKEVKNKGRYKYI